VDKRKILIQLDSSPQPSVFDRVVAVDAGADDVFSYGGVQPGQVRDLVHGAVFTRGPSDLRSTALFIGGNDLALGERLLREAEAAMLPQFGLRVSIMLDVHGANTTAAAATFAAGRHLEFRTSRCLVLGATGPVGQRLVRLLVGLGAEVRVGSRQVSRAEEVCGQIRSKLPQAKVEPRSTGSSDDLHRTLDGCSLVVGAGAAGAVLLPESVRKKHGELRVLIDLNAVPPPGIEGVQAADKGQDRDGALCYGAIGVGGIKMKLHKLVIARLFERNDQIFDAEQIYALAAGLKE
jgi:methylenetetrahydrofolate/methylenetetrahydromethanopterin dehydrogenase (NADP+)